MAVGDIKWLNGRSVRILSSGETPTVYWINGRPVVIHEYVASGGESVVPILNSYKMRRL